jgi:hypothetical protein
MKFTAKRLLVAGAIGIAAIATPISMSVLSGVANAPAASPSTPASSDTIVYGEGKGSSSNFIEYVPGDGSKPTTEAVTAGGGCSSPSIHGVPLLNLTALLYSSASYAGGTTSPAIVGAFQGRTGVCAITPDWAINNGGTAGAEALDFAVGSNSLVSSRIFSDAVMNVTAESGPSGPIVVELVESDGGSQVATQTCTLSGPGVSIGADTSAPSGGPCTLSTGTAGSLFDTLEIRVLTVNAEVSIVGPTSTFTLANQICAGTQLPSTGNAAISATLELQSGCKSYSSFSATFDNSLGDTQTLSFDATSAGSVPFTTTIKWAPQPDCQPDNSGPLNECAPTQVSYPGSGGFVNQTYCQTATAAQPMCTTNKVYNYIVVNGVTETQITETWSALIDSVWRH